MRCKVQIHTCPPCIYTCIYIFINLVIGCRFQAGSPDAIGHRMPVPGRFPGCHRTSDASSKPVRRMPPVRRRTSDVGPPIATVGRRMSGCHRSTVVGRRSGFGFGWPKPLHVARQPPLIVQVTLNSLCSTHRHKDNNICFTLYIVKALFDLSMWDIS